MAEVLKLVPDILAKMPDGWRGTTFRNEALLGRSGFAQNLKSLVERKTMEGSSTVTTEELVTLGNAEDYLRVATNISTTLEFVLSARAAEATGLPLDVTNVFTFGSATMPIVAVVLSVGVPVTLFCGDADAPFSEAYIALLKQLGGQLSCRAGGPTPQPDGVTLMLSTGLTAPPPAGVDGVVTPNVLYIINPAKINEAEILVMRKRMATPVTTPVAEAMLQRLAGLPETADKARATSEEITGFFAHLQEMSGTDVNSSANPVVFTAGLPTISSLWLALLERGGADILMSSTAYGGSSQLTDLITTRTSALRKHTFDIQGDNDIAASIASGLAKVRSNPSGLAPITVLFVEIPTNPDQKVPNMPDLIRMVQEHTKASGCEVLLLVDATFAPGSQVLRQVREIDPNQTAMVFVSMSKSVSRGLTTAGGLIANHTKTARDILGAVNRIAVGLDTTARPDQLIRLVQNHSGVEKRCASAYAVATKVGSVLQAAVKSICNHDMALAFPTPEQAKQGFTTSTFSFNLPGMFSPEINAGLAQRFVDELCREVKYFKPCVSFGQDNGLIYCTVPATSTQGAIREEDKAKQAIGGVQLVRLSFPPETDLEAVCAHVTNAVQICFGTSDNSMFGECALL